MSKVAGKLSKVVGKSKKAVVPVIHSPILSVVIGAGQATPAPPLGPQVGQRGLNVAQFCKDFNEKTKGIEEGAPMPVRAFINADRSYKMEIQSPMTSWLIMKAAGICRGSMFSGHEYAGKITLKHAYEIALMKSKDPINVGIPMEQLMKQIVGICRRMGIEVVKGPIDPAEYRKFLDERKATVEKQLAELEEKKAAKLLRTSS